MTSIDTRAHARVGLLGNPSDLYGGRGLGFTVAELEARVRLTSSATIDLANELFEAGWSVARTAFAEAGADVDARPFALAFESDIPFQAGLSGSSALLVAALRAWQVWFGREFDARRVAELAWRAENEVLGIRAGPLDRLVQAHDGLVAMDFERAFDAGATVALDPALLPPLLLAWHGEPGTPSGDVHAPIHARHAAGDTEVVRVMRAIADGAVRGRAALEAGDRATFCALVDANFDRRAELFPIAAADRALIDAARELGAAAKFPGSGGCVLVAAPDEALLERVAAAFTARGVTCLRPTVHRTDPASDR